MPENIPPVETVRSERQGAISIVTIDCPTVRNAVDGPTAAALARTFRSFDADPELALWRFGGGRLDRSGQHLLFRLRPGRARWRMRCARRRGWAWKSCAPAVASPERDDLSQATGGMALWMTFNGILPRSPTRAEERFADGNGQAHTYEGG